MISSPQRISAGIFFCPEKRFVIINISNIKSVTFLKYLNIQYVVMHLFFGARSKK